MKLIHCENPFRPSDGSTEVEFATREELLAYIAEHNLSSDKYALSLDGEVMPPEKLTALALPETACVVAMPVLGNKTLQSVALIAVAAAAIIFSGPLGTWLAASVFTAMSSETATALAFAVISIGGTLLVNGIASLFQKQPGGASYTFAGPQTVSRSGIAIPKGYGIFRTAPNIIQSWVDLQHADQDIHDSDDGASDIGRQWLNIICCFGWGPAVSLSDIRINGNDISSYADVAYFIKLGSNDQQPVTASDPSWIILNQTTAGSAPNTAPTTDFNRIVNNYPQSQRIRCGIPKNYVIVKGQRNDTQRLDVTVQFPRGVWRYDDKMVIKRLAIQYNVYYKLSTDTAWTLAQSHYYTNIRQTILRQITTIDNLPAGTYDIKVEKIGSGAYNNPLDLFEHESDYFGDELWLESVQETCYDALAYPNQILLGLRIMASDQIAGANVQISALVEYDTRVTMPSALAGFSHDNPALVAYDVLTDKLVGGGLDPADINLPIFVEWAELCDATVPTQTLTIAAPPPPFPPPAGQSVAWAMATQVGAPASFSQSPSIFTSAIGVSGGAAGNLYSGGLMVQGGSVFTPNSTELTWSGFKMPPGIPAGATIRGVYPTARITNYQSGAFQVIRAVGYPAFGPPSSGSIPQVLYGGNIGSISGQSIDAQIQDTGFDTLTKAMDFDFVGLAVYYDDPANTTATDATVYTASAKLATFNGIFEDPNKTVWDSFAAIGVMSRATPTRIGTQVGVMLDEPDSPVQVFNVGNIYKDSYSKEFLPIEDRANEVEVNYANAEDDYKTRNPVRCIPQEEQDAGYAIKKTRVNLLGCTSAAQAYYWGMHKLLENQLLLRTHKWDSPAQAIVSRVGNVVMLQHDVPKYARGGLLVGGTATAPILDAPYVYAIGQQLTVVYPALRRATGSIGSISGNVVSVSGYSGTPVKRLKVPSTGLDVRVTAYASGQVTVDSTAGLSIGLSVELYDLDVLAQVGVTGITVDSHGYFSTLTLASALPDTPVPDAPYILAEITSQPKLVRIRNIKRSGDQKFSITAIDYDPGVYDIPVPGGDDFSAVLAGGSAGNTAYTPNPVTISPATPPTSVVTPGSPGYNGSSVPTGNGSYTLSPAVCLSQPSATDIDLASVTVTYSDHQSTYGPQSFTITDPASTPTWYYVTVDSSGTFYCETATTKVGDPNYTYLGSILAVHSAGVHAAAMPGGWPIPSALEAVS